MQLSPSSPLPRPRRSAAFLLLGCLALAFTFSSPVRAQAPGVDPAHSVAAAPAVAAARFDLNFPGGSPQALVDLLRQASGEPVNALIPTEAASFTLPRMSYRHVTVEEVLAPLQWSQTVPFVRDGGAVTYEQEGYEWRREGGIWVMRVQRPTHVPVTFEVEPVNVRRLLEHYTIDDLTTAIDSAWKLQVAPAENQLLFHAETSLLILKGRPSDIATARNVLKSLDVVRAPAPKQTIQVNVLGEVNRPGTYTLPAQGTLVEAIAQAEGTTNLADRRKITIRREIDGAPTSSVVNFDQIVDGESATTPLRDGDTIYVKQRIL